MKLDLQGRVSLWTPSSSFLISFYLVSKLQSILLWTLCPSYLFCPELQILACGLPPPRLWSMALLAIYVSIFLLKIYYVYLYELHVYICTCRRPGEGVRSSGFGVLLLWAAWYQCWVCCSSSMTPLKHSPFSRLCSFSPALASHVLWLKAYTTVPGCVLV